MSWIEKLYITYENQPPDSIGNKTDKIPLLPIGYTLQNAHIEIVIDAAGNFLRANVIQKTNAPTIIPATEKSSERTRGYVPHPLCDKLQYVASDYANFGGSKPPEFDQFRKNLEAWCLSDYAHQKVAAVLNYVGKGQVVADLVNAGILPVDSNRKLLKKQTGKTKDAPEIFSILPTPEDAFIRWSVEIPGDPQTDLQSDKTIWKSWADYNIKQESTKGLCYVTGKIDSLAINHPKKIRKSTDLAKLISSNDTSGYTFLGRFTSANEAIGVSFEVSQKAHNALRWLVSRQGKQNGDQAIVAWAVSGKEIPDPFSDTLDLIARNQSISQTVKSGYTAQEIGIQLARLIDGYSVKLGKMDDVIVLALDSATQGRLAIRFYRELTASDFLQRVLSWHTNCFWKHFCNNRTFYGAPAPSDIAEAAYGCHIQEDSQKRLFI